MEFKKIRQSNKKLMNKLGTIVANDKSSFSDLLDSADIPVYPTDTTANLVERYIDELPENDNLKVLTAYFVEDETNFSGQIENENVYDNYNILYNYFDYDLSNEDQFYNVGGAIAGSIGAVANLGNTALQGRQKKKFGALDTVMKKEESKQELIKAILQQKQLETEKQKQEQENKSKQTKYWIIGGSVIGGLAIIGLIVYLVKKKNA